MAPRKQYTPIPLEVSIHLRYLHQDKGVSGIHLTKRYKKYARASIYKHMVKAIGAPTKDKRHYNKGRPHVLRDREKRHIIRKLLLLRKETKGNFTLLDVRKRANVRKEVSDSSVMRVIHKDGYKVRDSPPKGVLSEEDLKIRLKFARYAKKMLSSDVWTKEISFYLDGTGFTYKINPSLHAQRSNRRTYRKEKERCNLYCTGPGKHEGTGGRVAKFMVTIAYRKGVTLAQEYKETLNGEMFAQFIKQYFPPCFRKSGNPKGKLFLQDGDPSQNSRVAMEALAKIGGRKFSIPPRSPDLNPIENIFNIAKRRMRKEAMEKEITYETYPAFIKRIKTTFKGIGTGIIDRTIESMNKRIDLVIQRKGARIKY